jgi:hypothetical protein
VILAAVAAVERALHHAHRLDPSRIAVSATVRRRRQTRSPPRGA